MVIGVVAVAQQGFVEGLEFNRLLALDVGPLWGLLFIAAGLALCLIGYYLYRFMVAFASASVGGTLFYLFAPGLGIEGPGLWTTVVGLAIVLAVVRLLPLRHRRFPDRRGHRARHRRRPLARRLGTGDRPLPVLRHDHRPREPAGRHLDPGPPSPSASGSSSSGGNAA